MARNESNGEQDGSVNLPDSEEGQFDDIVEDCGEAASPSNAEDSDVEPDADDMDLGGRFEDADETELDQPNDAAFETKPVIAMNGSGEVSSLVEDMIIDQVRTSVPCGQLGGLRSNQAQDQVQALKLRGK